MNRTVSATAGRRVPAGRVSSRPRAERARQLADVLRQQITAGRFDAGRLSRRFGASRNAVREALGLLRDEGLVSRQPGVGTVVTTPKYGHGLDRLAGLAETLTGCGTVVNEVRVVEAVAELPAAIAERLEVAPGAGGVHLERLRWLGGLPLSLDTSYLTADVGAAVVAGDLTGRDVFALIEERTGCPLERAEVAVHAVAADANTAALLQIPCGAAVFAIERRTRVRGGRAVDVESIRIRADRMILRTTVPRGPVSG
ncbi:GntR family transcriptional regulator [Saccharopolyspora terrae]|uniref:GntR family transcriptional regulator n=1 Tax=Saccharopolyspora terrae TaxID=2530384 RepID=UPI001404DC73|nr:GntR family transcriptional regulator [Saccharopolyspora terrae]